jgi:hypothetical protein
MTPLPCQCDFDQKIAGKAREMNSGVWALGSFAARDHLLQVQEVI